MGWGGSKHAVKKPALMAGGASNNIGENQGNELIDNEANNPDNQPLGGQTIHVYHATHTQQNSKVVKGIPVVSSALLPENQSSLTKYVFKKSQNDNSSGAPEEQKLPEELTEKEKMVIKELNKLESYADPAALKTFSELDSLLLESLFQKEVFNSFKPIQTHTYGHRYVGQMSSTGEKPHGLGYWVSSKGNIHTGMYKNGMESGKGVMCFQGGDYYEGDFKYGDRHGHGKYVKVGDFTFVGKFKDGKNHGYGELIFDNNSSYKGNYVHGKFEGFGVYTFNNGNEYKGEWKNGDMEGNGVMTYWDGVKYEGPWVKDKKHGVGLMTYMDGSTKIIKWEEDHEIEWLDSLSEVENEPSSDNSSNDEPESVESNNNQVNDDNTIYIPL